MESRSESKPRNADKTVTGTPLDLRHRLNPRGVRNVVIEYGDGDRNILSPKGGVEEFGAYEMYQMSIYLKDLAAQQKRSR
jgi:hypothetical protein